MKIQAVNFGNKTNFPPYHEEMENKALSDIYKRVMAGERGTYKIDFYYGKKPEITNLSNKKNNGIINKIKNMFRKIKKG